MIDTNAMTLRATLIGIWESPEMILEFYGCRKDNFSSGKLALVKSKQATDFSYDIYDEEDKTLLSMATESADILDYEVAAWGSDWLNIVMTGEVAPIHLVRKKQLGAGVNQL